MAARILGRPAAILAVLALRLTARKVGVAVYWHGVGDPQEDPATHLVPRMGAGLFRAQVRHLARWYRPVRASDLLAAAAARGRGQRFPVALTFDDDLESHAGVARGPLAEAGVPGTFFLCGATLDGPHRFWWERIEPGPTAHAAAERLKAMSRSERLAEAARLERGAGYERAEPGLRREPVRALAAGGHEIGFHTLEHHPLPTLDDDELAAAMRDGRQDLEDAAGGPVRSVAYPHGESDARTPAAARAAGFATAFTTEQRAVVPGGDEHALPRLEAPFDSAGHLAVRVARALLRR